MSCAACSHWRHGEDDEPGTCSRYPVHIQTRADHTCGELSLDRNVAWNGLPHLTEARQTANRAWEDLQVERKRRIAAEKAATELRRKLRGGPRR